MENEKELKEEKGMEKTLDEAPHAVMVASSPDLGEASPDGSEQEILEKPEELHKPADYSQFSKKDFLELSTELSRDTNFKRVEAVLREIKPLLDEIRERERADA